MTRDTVALRDMVSTLEGDFVGSNRAFEGRKIHTDTLY